MKIGVDAYYLSQIHIDGIGNYLLRLIKELSLIDTKNQYYIYTPGVAQKEYARVIFLKDNFQLREVASPLSKSRRIWLQSPRLRRAILKDGISLFLGGGEYFPLFLPKRIQCATTIHDVAFRAVPEEISFINTIFYRIIFPLFVKRADTIFTVSGHSGEEIKSFLKTGQKEIRVIYNGIDIETFAPPADLKKEDYILFVGTLQPRKNLINLIKGYARAAEDIRENLVIVGGKSWRSSALSETVESLPGAVKKRIIFKGYISGEELIVLYQHARLFTLLTLHEGFCLPILEAMASGTAVLTARSAAIPEVYGSAVEYADPKDPEDIAARLKMLLADHDGLKKRADRGREYAQKYHVRNQAQEYLKAFDEIEAMLSRRGK